MESGPHRPRTCLTQAMGSRGTAPAVAVSLALLAGGCGGTDADAGSRPDATASSAPATRAPTPTPTATPTPTPTETVVPEPSGSPEASGLLDACAVVSADLITEHFGVEPVLEQNVPSSLGDPRAEDCAWRGSDWKAEAAVTRNAARFLREEDYARFRPDQSPPLPGTDWGFAGARPDLGLFTFVLASGRYGVTFSITVDSAELDQSAVNAMVQDLLPRLQDPTSA